jgi:hypothetical protein
MKFASLDEIQKFQEKFIKANPQLDNFKDLKREIHAVYQDHWAEQLFRFAYESVDFDLISDLGRAFLKYAGCQLFVCTRMVALQKANPENEWLSKYTRDYLRSLWDDLYTHTAFKGKLTLDDFPLRDAGDFGVPQVQRPYNPNYNSDAELDDAFFEAYQSASTSRSRSGSAN